MVATVSTKQCNITAGCEMGLVRRISVEDATDDIESDGNTYTGPRDVPGQASAYIHSGDTRKEAFRLSTFRRFPAATSPVLPAPLARSGFHYTGYKDRVKCFSCGIGVENWAEGDDVSDKKWHRTDCEFANGRDTTNIPLLAIYKKELEKHRQRRNGFHMQHGASNMIPQASSSITPVSNNRGNQSIFQSAEPRPISPTTQQNQDRYPCLHPVNPHMRSAVSRLESFKERSGIRWPRERLRAGIDDLVNAGFFYLGERDRVKCWYCNGGLQNWDYDDEPWTEHAKWFPSCHYLLRVKGPGFVDGVVAQYPELNRPVPTVIPRPLTPPPTGDIPPLHGGDIPPPSTSNPPSQHETSNAPPQSTPSTVSSPEQALEEAMMNLEYIQQARDMGYSDDVIKQLLKIKYETNGQFYATEQEFIETLLLSQAMASPEPQNHGSESTTPKIPSQQEEQTSSMLVKLKQLENNRACKVCYKSVANVVLMPCGHLSTCDKCVNGLRRCPICSKNIEKSIKTFRA